MFTVKIEDSDGEVTGYAGERYRYKYAQVDNYDDLRQARRNFQGEPHERLKGYYTIEGSWPTAGDRYNEEADKAFDSIREDVKRRFCGADDDSKFDNMLMRVGHIELFGGEEEYKSIVVFAGRVFIMNDEGQTVDRVDLLR